MCGRIARWLRFLGFDVVYAQDMEDDDIIKVARSTARVIVTRDRGLHLKALKLGLPSILLTSTNHVKNMAVILRSLDVLPSLPPVKTRCPLCNSPLIEVKAEDVKELLPSSNIATRYDKFWICPSCDKVYWIGSHWKNIKKVLDEILKEMREECDENCSR